MHAVGRDDLNQCSEFSSSGSSRGGALISLVRNLRARPTTRKTSNH